MRLPREVDGRLRGFGYVDFEDRESLVAAINIADLVCAFIGNFKVFSHSLNVYLICFLLFYYRMFAVDEYALMCRIPKIVERDEEVIAIGLTYIFLKIPSCIVFVSILTIL